MSKPKGDPPENGSPTPEIPPVPAAAIRDSRIGGTISLLCAAAISAQTLFGLGRVIGLSAWTAWLLPAALDVYAMTATRVAFQVPTGHRARAKAIWNARLALTFTTGSNCLYHAMHLAAEHTGWTPADWALIAVSALPPIVVERLLHLQSIVNSDTVAPAAPAADGSADTAAVAPAVPTPRRRQEVPTVPAADGTAADEVPTEVPIAVPSALSTKLPTAPKPTAVGTADRGADVIDMVAAGAAARRSTDAWAADALPVYRRLIRDHGTEPNAPQLAAALEAAGLGTLGASRARDVRKATEALHAATPETETEPERAEAVS